jgi:hypothetical protein
MILIFVFVVIFVFFCMLSQRVWRMMMRTKQKKKNRYIYICIRFLAQSLVVFLSYAVVFSYISRTRYVCIKTSPFFFLFRFCYSYFFLFRTCNYTISLDRKWWVREKCDEIWDIDEKESFYKKKRVINY